MSSSVIVFTLVAIMGVCSVFPLTGLTGLFTFGHASFMAVSGYVAALMAINLHMPFWFCLIAGVLSCAVLALIMGYPTLKLRTDYFSLMSVFLGEAITAVLKSGERFTGGAQGLSGIPKLIGLQDMLLCTVVVVFLVASLKYSRFGRMCVSIKTDQLASKSFGISVFSIKLKIYVFSAMLAGFAGVLYAFYIQFIDPGMFGWAKSSTWIILLYFGGDNSLTGAIIAATVLTILPEALRFASELRTMIYCALIILTVNFRPTGLLSNKEIGYFFTVIKRFFRQRVAVKKQYRRQ